MNYITTPAPYAHFSEYPFMPEDSFIPAQAFETNTHFNVWEKVAEDAERMKQLDDLLDLFDIYVEPEVLTQAFNKRVSLHQRRSEILNNRFNETIVDQHDAAYFENLAENLPDDEPTTPFMDYLLASSANWKTDEESLEEMAYNAASEPLEDAPTEEELSVLPSEGIIVGQVDPFITLDNDELLDKSTEVDENTIRGKVMQLSDKAIDQLEVNDELGESAEADLFYEKEKEKALSHVIAREDLLDETIEESHDFSDNILTGDKKEISKNKDDKADQPLFGLNKLEKISKSNKAKKSKKVKRKAKR